MLVVTGGLGFIGSNLVKALNERGREDILVVDDLANGHKLLNLADCEIADLIGKEEFLDGLGDGPEFEAIFHEGACSQTTEWDGRLMMAVNYDYSKRLLQFALDQTIPLIYASSASVYGSGRVFVEERRYERPLNAYAYSKFLFDQYVRRALPSARSQVVGLRYFNVYGPRERHKGEQASVAYKLWTQLRDSDRVRLFAGSDGYEDGEHRRDFVWVGDAVAVNLWFLDHPDRSGIFNVGTGRSQTFNDVARAVIAHAGRGMVDYVPMPDALRGVYQSFTEADITALRKAGYGEPFLTVEEGVARYMGLLASD